MVERDRICAAWRFQQRVQSTALHIRSKADRLRLSEADLAGKLAAEVRRDVEDWIRKNHADKIS